VICRTFFSAGFLVAVQLLVFLLPAIALSVIVAWLAGNVQGYFEFVKITDAADDYLS